ncbi:MAG: hypothetical protein AAFV07_00120 [Bacteroidota bacterium]
MKRLIIYPLSLLVLFSVLTSCGDKDLSLINEVKRFDPEWMNLSEQVSGIDRLIRITDRRYEQDLNEVDPFISDPASNERSNLFGLKSQYRNMMVERDELKTKFEEQKAKFVETVHEFNEWQNDLMKNKVDLGTARTTLEGYQKQHNAIKAEITETEKAVEDNIQTHNSIMRRITSSLKLYTNYDIAY